SAIDGSLACVVQPFDKNKLSLAGRYWGRGNVMVASSCERKKNIYCYRLGHSNEIDRSYGGTLRPPIVVGRMGREEWDARNENRKDDDDRQKIIEYIPSMIW
ncbi:hypothetical protein QE152_g36989, partial [Popillia japonica]